jgi:hypothetical protein
MHQNRLQDKRRRRQAKRADVRRRARATWRNRNEHPIKARSRAQAVSGTMARGQGAALGGTQFDSEPAPVNSLTSTVKGMLGL